MNTFTVQETWEPILSASSPEGFRDGTPTVGYLEHGQEFRIVIDLEWWAPIAPLFDLFLAEEFVNAFMDVGGRIIDVWGEGLYRIVIWAYADATVATTATQYGPLLTIPVIPIATAVSIAIIAAGLALSIGLLTLFIKISGEAADVMGIMMMVMMMVVMVMVLGKIFPSEKKKLPSGEGT